MRNRIHLSIVCVLATLSFASVVAHNETRRSAPIVHLGKIRLEPVKPDIGKPYLRATTSLQALALLELTRDTDHRGVARQPFQGDVEP